MERGEGEQAVQKEVVLLGLREDYGLAELEGCGVRARSGDDGMHCYCEPVDH